MCWADIFGSKFIYIHGIQRHHWAFVLFCALSIGARLPVSLLSQHANGSARDQRLSTTWVNVTLHCWAWPVSTTMFSMFSNDEEKISDFMRMWEGVQGSLRHPLHRHHICPGHVYLYLLLCYFKVSSAMTHIVPIHASINNWSPPVEYVALYFVSWRGLFSGICRVCICPPWQMLRLRPFGSEANISISKVQLLKLRRT